MRRTHQDSTAGSGLRRAAIALALPLAGLAVWEAVRRHDRDVLAADLDWAELNSPLGGRETDVVAPDGTRLHVEVFGPEGAPTIVLAHGWTLALRFWHEQIRDLSARHRVVAFDQRGHGRSSTAGPAGFTQEALADDLEAVLEATVPAGQRCVVVGHSMGGMSLVAWASRHEAAVRRRLSGALLLNTGMADLIPEALGITNPVLARAHRTVSPELISLPAPIPAYSTPLTRRLYRLLVLSPAASEGRVAFCEQMLYDVSPAARAGFGRLLSTLDILDQVPRLDVPTTVIAGAADKLTPPAHARRIAQALPDLVELVEIPGVGHMTPVEAPAVVTSRIRDLAAVTLGDREPVRARG